VIGATRQLTGFLDRQRIPYELLPHRHTESAGAEAAALGVDPHEVAKTVVLCTARGHVRAVIAACDRLDVRKLRDVLRVDDVPQLAAEAELAAAYPSFELGAVPPIGGPAGDRVVVDRRLAERDSVILEAGSHDQSVRLGTTRMLVLAHATIGDLCHD
jgi:Ala-tRNA(Pro) deacylase